MSTHHSPAREVDEAVEENSKRMRQNGLNGKSFLPLRSNKPEIFPINLLFHTQKFTGRWIR